MTMEINMKRMMQELKREIMEELPERCAKDVVKLLNKSGVRYKPMREAVSDKDYYEEGCGSFLNGAVERKEFVYDKKKSDTRSVSVPEEYFDKVSEEAHNDADYVTPARTNGVNFVGDGTPENPWVLNEATNDASSSEVPTKIFEHTLQNMKKYAEHKGIASEGSVSLNSATDKTEDVNGKRKRKRKLPLKLQHPMIIENPPKRQGRVPRKKPTPAIVVLDHKWCTDDVIDAYIGDLSLRVGHDRHLCSAWRSSFLLEKHRQGQTTEKSKHNDDHLLARNGAIQRVMDEYFKRDKAYFPVNISNTHWTTVVMHIPKQEFQVLDSLYPLTETIQIIRALRHQIAADVREYNKVTTGFFPDVSTWNIKSYDMPQQKDGNSCGLFVLQSMEH
ncbi:hypothetical protein ACQ4PT_033035 [Festuca glaucescens]